MTVDSTAGATAKSSILDPPGGHTVGFDPVGGGCSSTIPQEAPHWRIGSPGGATSGDQIPWGGGQIVGSDPGGGEGCTRESTLTSNIVVN